MEPIRPYFYWNQLGRQLKVWHHVCHISDAHASKLLRLWLGYEFTDLMDEFGRIPVMNFNEMRQRMGFAKYKAMMDCIRASRSFGIVGNDEEHVSAIYSPVWHNYEAADGKLLSGSYKDEDSQKSTQDFESLNNNTINKTTVSDTGVSDASLSSVAEKGKNDTDRDVFVRRQMVKESFFHFSGQQRTTTDNIGQCQKINAYLCTVIQRDLYCDNGRLPIRPTFDPLLRPTSIPY